MYTRWYRAETTKKSSKLPEKQTVHFLCICGSVCFPKVHISENLGKFCQFRKSYLFFFVKRTCHLSKMVLSPYTCKVLLPQCNVIRYITTTSYNKRLKVIKLFFTMCNSYVYAMLLLIAVCTFRWMCIKVVHMHNTQSL